MQQQASQTHINQEVAVALERLNGLMLSTIDRVKALEDERRDEDNRRQDRTDQRFQLDRGAVAIAIALLAALVQLVPHLHLS